MDFCNPDGMRDLYNSLYLSEEVDIEEGKKEFPYAKVDKQEAKHRKVSVSQRGGSRGTSRNRAMKMDSIRGAVQRGEDPRADGYGGARAARGNPPEDHRAAFSKNPLNNPPRPVKKPGVNKEEFESIVEYLFVEGYAETFESAELMAENIGENWIEEILEGYKEFPTGKVMNKAGKLMGSSAGKTDATSKKKEKRGIKMMDTMMQHTPDY